MSSVIFHGSSFYCMGGIIFVAVVLLLSPRHGKWFLRIQTPDREKSESEKAILDAGITRKIPTLVRS
jgi:hypothetical protein